MTQSEVNYYSENSDVTVIDPGYVPPPVGADWRPGRAGASERFVAGDATGHGWVLYFVDRFLVCELWTEGEWALTRWVDCSPLLRVQGTLEHLVGFGYDAEQGLISLGCATRSASGAAQVFDAFEVALPARGLGHPARVHLGGMPVALSGGGTQYRGTGRVVRPLAGRFSGSTFLTQGEFARLAGQQWRAL